MGQEKRKEEVNSISKLLNEHPRVALDTAIFIYHFENNPLYLSATSHIFNQVQEGKNQAVTTVITLAEILVKPLELKNFEAAEDYKNILNVFPNLTLLNINPNLSALAASLRAAYKITLPDALQIAGGMSARASLFITNDRKLTKVKEIEVVNLISLSAA